jgi:hypothetical protein
MDDEGIKFLKREIRKHITAMDNTKENFNVLSTLYLYLVQHKRK